MKTEEMRILASECGYGITIELIKEKCPSEFGYIDYGTIESNTCKGSFDKARCTKCWKEAVSPEDIEANIMIDKTLEENTEQVNHPGHYQQAGRRECIEEMRLMFGDEKVYWWCVMTAYKYRYRMGNKDGNPAEQDEKKAEFYLDYAEEMGLK